MAWAHDNDAGSFHLAIAGKNGLIAVASFVTEENERLISAHPYRLRGMAVAPAAQGMGHGSRLLRAGLAQAWQQQADLVWCHARISALTFYLGHGFLPLGPPFAITGLGPHRLLYIRA